MKKNLTIAAGLIAGAVLLMGAGPAMAHVDVGINIGIPGVIAPPVYVQPAPAYVQPAPIYVQPGPVYIERAPDREWHERRRRAREWREQQQRYHEDYRGEHRGHDD